MEVYKRPNSASWYVDVVHPSTGQRVRESLRFSGSKVEAQRKAARRQVELDTVDTTEIGVREATDRYIHSLQSRGKVYAKQLVFTQKKLFGSAGLMEDPRWHLQATMPLHQLTPALLEELVLARTREGNKPQTIKHELGLVRSAARYAIGLGYRAPAAMLSARPKDNPWRIPEVTKKTRYLSTEEFARVEAYLDPFRPVVGRQLPAHLRERRRDVHDLLVALAYTGARWSEIAGLTWRQVDIDHGGIRLWGNKTKQERVVPIAEPLREVLLRRLQAADIGLGMVVDKVLAALVFPGPGGAPRTAATRAIGEAMDACGLNTPELVAKHGRATVHSLRHTFASWLVQNGAELSEVSGALGHSSVLMTSRYAHLSKGATVAKLGGILNNLGGK